MKPAHESAIQTATRGVVIDACFRELLANPQVELRRPSPRLALADLRAGTTRFMSSAVGPRLASVTDIQLALADGMRLHARRYGRTADPLPTVVFCHGGGFVFGDLDTHDAMCRSLAVASGAAIIAIDYRRAPENPFPAALEDVIAAVKSLHRDPGAAGVRNGPIALAGESAGGHLAIGAAIAARSVGIELAHLALLYPVIAPGCDTDSMRALATGCLLSREAMQWYWDCYVPGAAARTDPRVDLLKADLAGLPPATVAIAECDPLRDEDEAFVARLVAAGIDVGVHRYAGMVHGFAGLPQFTPVAAEALTMLGSALGRALGAMPSGPG